MKVIHSPHPKTYKHLEFTAKLEHTYMSLVNTHFANPINEQLANTFSAAFEDVFNEYKNIISCVCIGTVMRSTDILVVLQYYLITPGTTSVNAELCESSLGLS